VRLLASRWRATCALVVGAVSTAALLACLVSPVSAQQAVATDDARNHRDATAAADSLLLRRVSVSVDHLPLRSALDVVARAAGVHVTYRLELVDDTRKTVTLHARNITLGDAFGRLFEGTALQVIALPDARLGVGQRATESAQPHRGGILVEVIEAKTQHPLAHVNLMLDDSVQRAWTDDQGHAMFLNVSAGRHRVSARMVGFTRQTRLVTTQDDSVVTLTIVMDGSVNTLDQVVVTATGAQRYRELGHVVATINADSLVKTAPIMTLADLLTSRVPGLQVSTSGGTVGGEVGLRLRGQSTLSLDPQPIVIVDGVRYRSTNTISNQYGDVVHDDRPFQVEGRSPLNDLNVNDIEKVEVVKGPSASTLYGPDAANGVIVITTKRGKAGKPEWHVYAHPSLRSSVPEQRLARGYQAWGHVPGTTQTYAGNCTLLQQYQYHNCIQDSITRAAAPVTDPDVNVLAPNRLQGQAGVSVNGGTGGLVYYLSGNYDSQLGSIQVPARTVRALQQRTGLPITSVIKSPNAQQNADMHANLSTSFGDRGTLSLTTMVNQSEQRGIDVSAFSYIYSSNRVPAGLSGIDSIHYLDDHSFGGIFLKSSHMQSRRITGDLSGDFKPFAWLNTNASVGVDIGASTDEAIVPTGADYTGSDSYAANNQRNTSGRTMSVIATATAKPGMLSFRTSAGVQYVYSHLDGLNATGSPLAPGSTSIGTAQNYYVQQVWNELITLGTFGEEVMGINERLFLTGSMRVDGATSFGDAYHPRLFPKVGVSWIASDEPMLRNIPGLNELRFRYSIGSSSRAPTTGMKLGVLGSSRALIEQQNQVIYARGNLANPDIRPERAREAEYGIDATVIDNRVHLSLTGYKRRTDDQIAQMNEPQGLPSSQYVNIGNVSAHGFETTVTVNVIQANSWNMDLTLNTDYQTTKLLSLGFVAPSISEYGGYAVGYPLGAAFGRRIIGFADTAGGGPDGVITSEEVVFAPLGYLGQLYPPHTYTLTPTVTLLHGHMRLSTLFDRETGFIQSNPYLNTGCADNGLCLAGLVKGTPLLDQAKVVASSGDFESGNFTRWRELSATVDLPERLLRTVLLKRGQVSVQVRNLALWSAYKGPDPEAQPGAGLLATGSNQYGAIGVPNPRTWTVRFDVTP